MKPILVTCYKNPDIDGYAGAVAYAEFLRKKGIDARAGIFGRLHEEAKYVLKRFNINTFKKIGDIDDFEKIILVDTSCLDGLDKKISPDKVIEIIDHRKVNEKDKFPKAKIQIELVGAAATLIAEKFKQDNIAISKESAILIYSAIISNTLNFKGGVTTKRDKIISKWLEKFVQFPKNYWKELFTAKSDLTSDKLLKGIENDFALFALEGKRVGIAQLEIIGAEKLLKGRQLEIMKILDKIKIKLNLDFIFLNIIELEKLKNFIITDNDETKDLLSGALKIKFKGDMSVRKKLIMRKQIVPLMQEELEKDKYKEKNK